MTLTKDEQAAILVALRIAADSELSLSLDDLETSAYRAAARRRSRKYTRLREKLAKAWASA